MAGKSSVFVDGSAPSVDAVWLNLRQNEVKNLVESSGQTLSDANSNQQAIAVADYAANGDFYTDSGSANAYNLNAIGSQKTPDALRNGMQARFRAINNSTGASTATLPGLPTADIKKEDGSGDTEAGDISTAKDTFIRYDGTNFRLTGASTISPGVLSSFFESAQQTITLAGSLTLAHSLPSQPTLYKPFLQCTTAEHNYSISDETPLIFIDLNSGGAGSGVSIVPDSTNLNIRYGNNPIYVLNKTTGVANAITVGSWRFVIRAWV